MTHSKDEAELLDLITRRSFRRGTFQLSSGGTSTRYFNLKPTMMHPRGAFLCARAFLARASDTGVDYVGGLEMGAVPIIAAMAALSDGEGRPLRTFFVRKAPKAHGTRDVIEGLVQEESLGGSRVLIVDDVATTGTSILKAAAAAREAGANVHHALVLVDREEGAAAALGRENIHLLTVFRAADFDG
jgi:orotate phosphoribosyltransferase